jgi:hypothetical protein
MSDTTPPPTPSDRLIGRVLVLVGLIGLVATLGIIALALRETDSPEILSTIAIASLTGLTALLVGRRP